MIVMCGAMLGCGGGSTLASDDDAGAVTHDSGHTMQVDTGKVTHDAGAKDASPDEGTAPSGTSGVECDYHESTYNSSPSVMATSTSTWSCTATLRSVAANGIPDHPTGTFPNVNCPNAITTQDVSASMTLSPVNTGSPTKLEIVGYAFNGVKFDPSTAGTCGVTDAGTTTCTLLGDDGSWNLEALGQTTFDFGVDDNNAHVQPTGTYHYHGMPTGILTNMNKGMAMTLVGYALDGFPVYARYGYTDAGDATSAIKVVSGSYQKKATPDPGRPPVSTYPMGTFTQDYEYVAGSGDLDECNGRFGVTPEFPRGIYQYFITDTYPFIQRCVMGTPMTPAGGPPPDGGPGMMMMGPPPDGGMPPRPGH
jgi:hypothetical protein